MMMMEKPKHEEEKKESSPSNSALNSTDAIEDLERRLNRLGGSITSTAEEEETEEAGKTADKSNSLLARIQAAQERAREAQKVKAEEDEKRMLEELNNEAQEEEEETKLQTSLKDPPPSFDMIEHQQHILAPPKILQPPPPTFEELEQSQITQQPPPPPFEILEQQAIIAPPPSAPDVFEVEQEEQKIKVEEADISSLYAHALNETAMNEEEKSTYDQAALQEMITQEQIRIMAQIEQEKKDVEKALELQQMESSQEEQQSQQNNQITASTGVRPPEQTVQIAPNHFVPLHGPDMTRQAITHGTAILTQCFNCHSYLHITNTATLMYCPCCQTVSPVTATGKDQAAMKQERADRKMAERLHQQELAAQREAENSNESSNSGWMTSLFGASSSESNSNTRSGNPSRNLLGYSVGSNNNTRSTSSSGPPTSETTPSEVTSQKPSQSWGEYFSSYLYSSNPTTEEEETARTPLLYNPMTGVQEETPSTSTAPPLVAARTGQEIDVTTLPPARVAERKPAYECLVDGANSVVQSAYDVVSGGQDENEGNMIHGVDTTSLLLHEEGEDADRGYDRR